MKKSGLILGILVVCSFAANAQFFNAIGIAAGVSYNKEGWSNEQWATQEQYVLRYNGAVIAEFFDDPVYQWRSELMYNMLDVKELVVQNKYINQTNYITFNNYLKYRHEFYRWIPYVLIGPRVAYLMTRSASVFPDVIGGMYSFHVSAAVGIGIEKVCYSRFKPFAEFFYNHDLMPSFIGHTASIDPYPPLQGTAISETIMQHDFELRIGVKYHIKGKPKCPAVDNAADGGHMNNPP